MQPLYRIKYGHSWAARLFTSAEDAEAFQAALPARPYTIDVLTDHHYTGAIEEMDALAEVYNDLVSRARRATFPVVKHKLFRLAQDVADELKYHPYAPSEEYRELWAGSALWCVLQIHPNHQILGRRVTAPEG